MSSLLQDKHWRSVEKVTGSWLKLNILWRTVCVRILLNRCCICSQKTFEKSMYVIYLWLFVHLQLVWFF